ncbi:MAG: hypothetical protein ACD_54C00559G0002 [uncultured bacterium]|nr:MAG: hypothetical protein ACD_54C00559G0002 [uncultured bacterium]
MTNTTRQLFRHPARARHHCIQIERGTLDLQAEFLGAVHQMKHLGTAQQRLGRDTAPVQADTAQIFAFDNRHLLAQLAGPNGSHIATGACADHDHVECLSSHLSLLRKSSLPLN